MTRDDLHAAASIAPDASTSDPWGAIVDAATGTAIIATTASGVVSAFSAGAERMFGIGRKEVVGQTGIESLFLIGSSDEVADRLEGAAAAGHKIDWKLAVPGRNGRVASVHVTRLPAAAGVATGFVVVAEEVTEQREKERDACESRELLSLVLESIPNPIFYKDADGRYVDCNRAFSRYLGLSREEVIGRTVFDIAPPELAEVYHEADLALMKIRGTQVYEARVKYHDGSFHDVMFYKSTLTVQNGDLGGLVGIMLDITDRKEAERALRESEEQLRLIFETSQAGIIIVSASGAIAAANPRMAEMFGYSSDNLIGMPYRDFVHPSHRGAGCTKMSQLISGEIDHVYLERLYVRSDGRAFWGFLSGRRLVNPDGSLRGLVGIIADITEAREARDQLEREKERLAVTLRSIGDGVIAVDTSGNVVFLNQVAEQLSGWTQAEAAGRPAREIFRIVNERTRQTVMSPVDEALRTGAVIELANHTILIAADGTERAIEDSAAPIRDRAGTVVGVVLVFRDATEKKAVQEELFRKRKLESLGVLAGGIAHDFNNLLTGIMGNISVVSYLLPDDAHAQELLERARKGVDRAADLTMQLLTFSKGGAPIKKVTSLREIVTDSASFALRGANVRCTISIPDDLWPVEVDPGQMSQVVNNLVLNADQAMPQGGVVTITAENVAEGPDRIVRVIVEDHGVGIPHENLYRIFDPYFTTKENGSGLGLATVHSIVRNHDGEIRVTSRLGEGTRFIISLPAYETDVTAPAVAANPSSEGSGKVLVVDDEEAIRLVAEEGLAALGYTPVVCGDGREAIALYAEARASGEPFAVVVMDLTIPGGMGGKEAVAGILALDPGAKVIVSSGYSSDPVIANFREHGFCAALPKPFSVQALGSAVALAARQEKTPT